MKLSYEGFDRAGRAVADVIEAASYDEADRTLRRRGLYLTQLTEAEPAERSAAPGPDQPEKRTRRPSLKGMAFFTRQLAVLVSTGTPLVQALEAVERQMDEPAWAAVIGRLRRQVEEGVSLSVAMGGMPEVFDPVCRSVIAAGESSGQLRAMLDRLADMTRRRLRVRNTLIGTLTYPLLLIFIATSVLVGMIVFVLPQFAGLFKSLDTPLPTTTKALMLVSDAVRKHWMITFPAVGTMVGAAVWWLRSVPGRQLRGTVIVNMPILGKIVRSFITARVVRLLGLLLESKVQLLDSLDLTRQAAGNPHYERVIDKAKDAVTRGDAISVAFRNSPMIPAAVGEAMLTGERTGQLAAVMLTMADTLDEDNELVIKSMTSILEPLILLLLGVIVGLVAFSMFMPLLDLTAATQQGGPG